MLNEIALLIGDKDTITITVSRRNAEQILVAIIPELDGQQLAHFTAGGTPAELSEKLMPAFSESLKQARSFFTNGDAMIASAKDAGKKAGAKTKVAPAANKTTPATNKTAPVATDNSAGSEDGTEEEEEDDDADKGVPEVKPEPKVEEKKPFNPNKTQKKVLEKVQSDYDLAMTKTDPMMVTHLKKRAVEELTKAEIPVEDWADKYDVKIKALEAETNGADSGVDTAPPPFETAPATKEQPPVLPVNQGPPVNVTPTQAPVNQAPTGSGVKINVGPPPGSGAGKPAGEVTVNPSLF